nr:23S rRNA (uracil(747)-C(5))-methyltransferase RlmC [Klebsiella pneumoniae]
MHCALYDAGRCRSCQWLERPVPQQLADKMADLRTLLAAIPVAAGASRSAGRRRLSVTRLKWWSAAALSVRCWGCCTAMALRWTSPTARSIPPSLPRFCYPKALYRPRRVNTLQRRAQTRELKYLLLTASQQGR